MPARNSLKVYAEGQYYHVYNRGVAKQAIFLEAQDKQYFLNLFARHLDPTINKSRNDGVPYPKFDTDIELLCYCLMGNHFHLMFYIKQAPESLSLLLRSVLTAYTMYFNKKYRRVGTLFQGVFKATLISSDAYLAHITRYIHLNPRTYRTYHYSSLRYYLGEAKPPHWVKPERITEMFNEGDYAQFIADYKANHDMLEQFKHELADQ